MAGTSQDSNMNLFQKVAGYFQGRHTLFVCICLIVGVIMSWYHRLDGNLVTLLLGLQGLILGHSVKEDYFNGQKL